MKFYYIPIKRGVISNILIVAVLTILFLSLGLNNSISVFSRKDYKAIYHGDPNKEMVAFECNVVWGTEYVPQMLDIFAEKDVKITFFIGGEWAKDNPELLKKIAEEGHEIGNHGYGHKHHSRLNLDQNRKEILDTENVIKSIIDYKTDLFAPPYGEYNDTTLKAAQSLGYKTIMWSIDTIDWRRDGVDKILNRVFKNPHNGAMILMHPTKDTVTALPQMIDRLRELGYEIVPVSEVLEEEQ